LADLARSWGGSHQRERGIPERGADRSGDHGKGRPGRQLARSPIASAGRALLDRMQRSLYEA